MLYFKKQVFIIDVSQSVELDHPRALDFLRVDCVNVTRFFTKSGVENALSAKRLYDFVSDPSFGCDDETEMDSALERMINDDANLGESALLASEANNNVFMQSNIPRSLNQVEDYERVAALINEEHSATLDAVAEMTRATIQATARDAEDEEESGGESSLGDDDEWLEVKPSKPSDGIYRVKTTTPEERKAHKTAVKAAKAEQRKTKVKKADKKLHRFPKR